MRSRNLLILWEGIVEGTVGAAVSGRTRITRDLTKNMGKLIQEEEKKKES